jgi:hypothetical protein
MKKYKQLIQLLKGTSQAESELHPLRKEQIRVSLIEQISGKISETNSLPERYILQERGFRYMPYIASFLVAAVALGGTSVAASQANPGEVLFPVKKAQEVIRLRLATNENAQAQLRLKMVEERFEELAEITKEKESKPEDKDLVEAETESKAEISNAIETLTRVQAKLEAKGNTQAAASIKENILKFESRVKVEDDTTVEDEKKEERKTETDELEDADETRGNSKVKVEESVKVEIK